MDLPSAPFTQQHTFMLAAGITLVLALASVIGFGLKITVAKRQPHGAIDNLNTRVNAWWVMSIVVGLALLAGKAGVTLLFAFASFVALREFVAPAPNEQSQRALLLVCLAVVLPLQYLLVASGLYALYALFIPVVAMVVLPVMAAAVGRVRGEVRSEWRGAGERIATLQCGLVICVFCISHVPALLTLEIPGYEGRNAFLVIFLVLVVQSCDVLQYLWGKLAGRRRIAPTVSPSKTVEGSVGGIVSATALGALLSPITPFSVGEAALISLAMTLLGFLGGLLMSAQKRRRGIKDWGTLIRGHGGMLDRLDSLFLSAPVFLNIVRIGWAA